VNQREKDLEHAALRDNVTRGTMEAFVDGAAYAREELAKRLAVIGIAAETLSDGNAQLEFLCRAMVDLLQELTALAIDEVT
jgi:hypothetical protein